MNKEKIFKFKVSLPEYKTLLSYELRSIQEVLGSDFEVVDTYTPWYSMLTGNMTIYVRRK